MSTPRTGGGGGGGGGSSRRGRMGETPVVVVEQTSSNNNNNDNNNNNNTATTTQKAGGVSRLPSIKERDRRPSQQKKARTSSVNDATSEGPTTTSSSTTITTLQRQESTNSTTPTTPTIQRRSSVNTGLGLRASKPTFAGIGRRVSHMVRARMAFQNRRKSSTSNAEEVNHMEHIHEMPRNPRFTTFLSPEAQYAMMKGYEDMLYDKITKTMPESRLVMKRTKTPFHKKVSIVDNRNKEKDGGGGGKSGVGGNTPSATTTTAMSPESEDLESVNDASGDSYVIRSTTTALPTPFGKAGRSQSTVTSHVTKSLTSSSSSSSSMPRASGSVGFALHRASSLPSLETGLSRERRLVLTYRLESAMDILDTLKRRNMENSLSPRVFRIPRQVDAVKDFNSWTKVWNKEFKVAHVK